MESTVGDSLELSDLNREQSQSLRRNPLQTSDLSPIDRGVAAWTFVFASFILETFIWGFLLSFGIFQDYYMTHPPFDSSSTNAISAIGTVGLGVVYNTVLLVMFFGRRFPTYTKPAMWISLFLCVISLFTSSFATQIWQLILLQGVVFGLGGSFMYAPLLQWLSEWFIERRGLAGSIIFGGSGVGGAVFPFLMTLLLDKFGLAWTLRIFSLLTLVFGGIALLFVRPRIPVTAARATNIRLAPTSFTFLRSPLFAITMTTVLIQSLAYFPIGLYIPTYTSSLGLPTIMGTAVLSVFNATTVLSQIGFGLYSDRFPYTSIMMVSGLVSGVSAFLLWGFATSLPIIFVFVVIFGSLSGGFSAIFPAAAVDITKSHDATSSGTIVLGLLGCAKGLAAVIGPQVAGSLYHPDKANEVKRFGSHGFGDVTLFVGIMMFLTIVGSIACQYASVRARAL